MDYPRTPGLAGSGSYRCPKCTNSLQNAPVWGETDLMRCATCKTVFQVPQGPVLPPSRFASEIDGC